MLSRDGGFRVLVPDLYKGKVGVDAEEASHLMSNLDFKAAVKEMAAAADYLRATGSPRVGAVGFCMGGALAFAAAQHAGVDCAAPFYGIPDPAICTPAEIRVPVQAHFGCAVGARGGGRTGHGSTWGKGAGAMSSLFLFFHSPARRRRRQQTSNPIQSKHHDHKTPTPTASSTRCRASATPTRSPRCTRPWRRPARPRSSSCTTAAATRS